MKPDYEIIAFKNPQEWRQWLVDHHGDTEGVWIRLYKKASGVGSVNYAEALDDALCFGWIDGQVKSYDELSYLQKFTPRRKRSLWSKRNIEHVARLTEAGLMMPAGIQEVDKAKDDGRWQAAYDKPSEMEMPEDFMEELSKNTKAKAFFDTLNKTNKYTIAWRLQTAKSDETRKRRQDKILAMLEAGEKLV
jgi:uncharacterized protein YdeI (YjbR/CyaY-like superfamily)